MRALTVAELIEDRRLVAALLLDLADARDKAALEAIANTATIRALRSEHIPPGCDTHDIALRAFIRGTQRREPNVEASFGEVLDRATAIAGGEDDHVHVRLERVSAPFEFEDSPCASAFEMVCASAGVQDNSDWTALANGGVSRDSTFSLAGDTLPIRVVLRQILYAGYGATVRLVVDGEEGVRVVICDK